jgi:hypothetical protein
MLIGILFPFVNYERGIQRCLVLLSELDFRSVSCRYGKLEDFEKGVRELVGAPHPQVWDEINKEHMQRGDESTRPFSPGNYKTTTCSKDEFLIVIDPSKGKEASLGKRCALVCSRQFRVLVSESSTLRNCCHLFIAAGLLSCWSHHRNVKSLDNVRKEKMAIKAKLWKEELLGLSLYTVQLAQPFRCTSLTLGSAV